MEGSFVRSLSVLRDKEEIEASRAEESILALVPAASDLRLANFWLQASSSSWIGCPEGRPSSSQLFLS